MCKQDRIHDRQFSVLRAIRSDLKITPQENIKLPMSPERAVLVFRILDLKKSAISHSSCWREASGEAEAPLRCEQRGGSLERGSDRLVWSSPGTFPEPEVVKSQGPQQIEVYSRHQLLGTATPNHSLDLGPPDAGGGLGEHREGGDWGRNRAGRQAAEGVHFLRGSGSKASPSQPIHPQCYPQDQKSETGRCCMVTTGTEWQEPR